MSQPAGPGPAPSPELDAVLDAAAACYLRYGVDKTTALDIAKAAGMSRATLYRRYGSHEAIFLAVLVRESEEMARDAEAHLATFDRPGRAHRRGHGVRHRRDQPPPRPRRRVHHRLGRLGRHPGSPAERAADSWARPGSARCWRPAQADGTIGEQAVDDLVDWMLRILISYAAVPGRADLEPTDIRRHLTTLFLPALDGVLVAPEGAALT